MEQTKTTRPVGRPTDYRPEFCQKAIDLCERGATDDELAECFEVSTRTIFRWKAEHPEFCQAVRVGKQVADDRVERSLYQMATGRYVVEQQAIKVKLSQYEEEVKIVDVEKFLQPEATAAAFWLKNRKPEQWRDVSRQENTGANGGPIKVEQSDAISDLIRKLTRLAPPSTEGGDGGGIDR